MTAIRSQNIYGRIKRVLRLRGFPEDTLNSSEIYDEMNEGQKQIYIRARMDVEKVIYLSPGVTDYPLLDSQSEREIYGDILQFITPATWKYALEFVSPNGWNEILNGKDLDKYSNPVRVTVFANILRLYPAPQTDDELKIFAHLIMPIADITADDNPEIPEYWDKAIEDYALFQLLGEPTLYQSFIEQVNTLNAQQVYRGYRIQKSRVIW